MIFPHTVQAAATLATAWRFVSRRNKVFDGEVIRVVTSSSAPPGRLLGSATVIVRVRGCSLRKKGTGVASTERTLRSGNFPLGLSLAAWLGASRDVASSATLMESPTATVRIIGDDAGRAYE